MIRISRLTLMKNKNIREHEVQACGWVWLRCDGYCVMRSPSAERANDTGSKCQSLPYFIHAGKQNILTPMEN